MKILAMFDLADEDDKYDYDRFKNLDAVFRLMHEFEQKLRHWRKYSDVPPSFEEVNDAYFDIRSSCFCEEIE